MLRSLSTKVVFAILAAIVFLVALIAIAREYLDQRVRLREHAAAIAQGDPSRGEAMFIQYGCGSCHSLRNVRTATGMVGPPLDGVAVRAIIAGKLPNQPDNMVRWIRDPQQVTPGTAMPDLHVSGRDARDITAFLYTRAE